MANLLTHLYRTAMTNLLVQQTKFREDSIGLRNEQCRSRFLIQPKDTGKVCLFFHGFTAAPFQFASLGQILYQAGYNIMIPLLPGHGRAGNWDKNNPPPLPLESQVYKDFAIDCLKSAKTLGDEVVVGGLSGGGTLATWLSVEKATDITRSLLFAPYLGNSRFVLDLLATYSKDYVEWKDKAEMDRVGYSGFPIPATKAILRIGQEAVNRAQSEPTPPMFILATDLDAAVNNNDHLTLFDAVRKREPSTWYYRFPKELAVPHAMLIKEEGTQWENLLNVMVKAYLQSDLAWDDVEEIAYRMTEGKTFPQVVNELNLADKVSPDVPTMITMIDKRSIVEKRNPNAINND
ncbi:alpha/beta fold hydrolase [Alkalinema sp. FACHB-956]|uniref:alpha/beta hydrolase n=1 Tax=Alkalinema sp. FACHB-956 TaxID=2692768 RepID=UPI001688F39D|nr:alpha/beta fold hydrolase [Alkalinema sp. FACHB-956]MBD2327298.1 alpha/beta fold hydrolase [Alkalinema sp. FACHB-956]